MDLYLLLNLSPDCTSQEIEAAQKRFCKNVAAFAPGVVINDENLSENFPEISQGFNVLLNPVRRAEYDKTIRNPAVRPIIATVQPETELTGQKLTFRQWLNQAT